MNKRQVILEKARLRLLAAEQAARESKRKFDTSQMIADRMEENDVYLFLEEGMLIITSLKRVITLH